MRHLFWFRHDLRLADNAGFHAACRAGEVVPCVLIDPFFFTNPGIGPNRTALYLRAVESLANSLEAKHARLIVRLGKPAEEIPRLLIETKSAGVFCNRDYERYALERDARVESAVKKSGGSFTSFKDLVIFERGEVLTQADKPYTIFSQYKKTWLMQADVPAVLPVPKSLPFPTELRTLRSDPIDAAALKPESAVPEVTEAAARALLDQFLEQAVYDYVPNRDLPALEGTSRLSPHLKFGTISPRTVVSRARAILSAAKKEESKKSIETFISELVWRDFFFQIVAEFPHVERSAFKRQFDGVRWENSPERLAAWKAGRTGHPIVDAGMRQLRQTGWMHNRVRMITASFLCKDLLLDWREGEKHFSRLLIDGEPAVNNGNWQWAAGTGTDAQPYFRIFNPTTQSQRFDPTGAYIRRWVPELSALDADEIHEPWLAPLLCPDYPPPIVDHATQREKALKMYQAAREI